MPVVWGVLAVLGIGATGYTLREAGEAADAGARLMKWTAAAGALYLSYQAARQMGALK